MEIRFGRDIVTFKHVIEAKVNDEELESMIQDSQLVMNALENLKGEAVANSPLISLLQAIANLPIRSR